MRLVYYYAILIAFYYVSFFSVPNSDKPDHSIYITKVIPDGAAAIDGRLQAGDKIVSANGVDFSYIIHPEALKAIKV